MPDKLPSVRAYNKRTREQLNGMLARFPKAQLPVHSYWTALMDYLMEHQPNNKQQLKKASKMIARHES